MTAYVNNGGNSGVLDYDIKDSSIVVRFKDYSVYEYPAYKIGLDNLNHMKSLARRGSGLNSFINTNQKVKFGYLRR